MIRLKKSMRSVLFWLILLSCFYFTSRLINLTQLPIFTDEAIYIRWAQIGERDASWRFISLTDGKQPLFTWIMMGMLRIIPDPLAAGRMVSVLAGFFSLTGLYVLVNELWKNRRIGLLSGFLYVISPFALMYDRMALYDSLVCAFSIWNLYLAILLVRSIRLDVALLFGMTLGVGLLNKTSVFISMYLIPATLLLFNWRSRRKILLFFQWVGLVMIVVVLSQLLYSILRLSPFFYIIKQKDALFIYPFREWIKHPFIFFYGNIHGMFDWVIRYMTMPVFFLSIVSLIFPKKMFKEKLLLFIWWAAPFTGLALFGRVLYPRFVLFMIMPLLVLAADMVNEIFLLRLRRIFTGICIFVLVVPSLFSSYKIITDITNAPIPKSDLGQYVNDWPSGWGVREIVAFIGKEAEKGKVSIYTEGTFGLLPYAFEIYLVDNKNVTIHGLWPLAPVIPENIRLDALAVPAYLVTYQTQAKPNWPLILLSEYQKGNNTVSKMRLYRIETGK